MVEKYVLLCFVKIVNFSGVHLALSIYKKYQLLENVVTRGYVLAYITGYLMCTYNSVYFVMDFNRKQSYA